ncbi:MAG: NusG domain II-containing protein [Lachnospiraceae bacterium]|nr:NusG domain II-containing protein [Lachnospiraceae bacterium]MBR5739538.1 NusG domain II-containing protein [Lachnospiraceae bacterium]
MKYRKDILLIGGLLLVSGLLFLGVLLFRKPGNAVSVQVNGQEIARYDLSRDIETVIRTEDGENTLVIRNGEARITHADCRDQICVHRGAVSDGGETIVCLPHKLVIAVEGEQP